MQYRKDPRASFPHDRWPAPRDHGTGRHIAIGVEGWERDSPDRTRARSLRHRQAYRTRWAARSFRAFGSWPGIGGGVAKVAKIVGQRGSGRLTVQTEWGQREHFLHLYANTRNKATEASEGVPPAALIISHDWRRLLPGMRTYILCDRAASRRVKERSCRGGLAAKSARDHTAYRRLYRVKNEQEVGTPFINRVREEVGGHRSEGYDGPGRA